MRQNQRNEKQASEQTSRLLESSGNQVMTPEERQDFELGQLIRESATAQLPAANPELRELLANELDRMEDKKVALPRSAPVKKFGNRNQAWAIAVALFLAIGTWAFYHLDSGIYQSIADSSLNNQIANESWGEPLSENVSMDSAPVINDLAESRSQNLSNGPIVKYKGGGQDMERNSNREAINEKLGQANSSQRSNQSATSNSYNKIKKDNLSASLSGEMSENESTALNLATNSQLQNRLARPFETVKNVNQPWGTGTAQEKTPQTKNTERYYFEGQQAAKGFAWYGEQQPNVNYLGRNAHLGFGRGGGGLAGARYERAFGIQPNSEQYEPIHENKFIATRGGDAVSTFSIDVDTASYANVRRFLTNNQMPPRDSVRIEELINYFSYDYPQPSGDEPFSVNMEFATCPWNNNHKLLRIGLKGKDVHVDERPATNLVFLIDVSGSMNNPDKLSLLKRGFQMMVNKLTENDRVSIVTYAGNAGVVLEPTSGDQKQRINNSIEQLTPGGSTHGSAGIELAYKLAQKHFIKGGVNKVILATDGDLNVGITDDNSLVKLIKQKASEDVFLTVLGFGTGNLKDAKMEKLADNGNGMYAYIDSIREAQKVLVEQMSGSLVTIAKDVKIQIEFNPAEVKAYRLIGYENRMLATQDFDDDQKDAGEIGAGHTVTALYELVTSDKSNEILSAPKGMKYQTDDVTTVAQKTDKKVNLSNAAKSGEMLTLALRYKKPDENTSKRSEFTLMNDEKSFSSATADFRFAASVASFGMLLRQSQYAGDSNPAMIQEIASAAIGEDKSGYRAEFIDLVRKAGTICD